MSICIIIVTMNITPLIYTILRSLQHQTSKAFYVRLVYAPTASKNDVQELLNAFSDLTIVHMVSIDTCLSRSRNLALEGIDCDIVAFADDDCVYEHNTVEQVLAAFEQYPQVQCIMGTPIDLVEKIGNYAHHPKILGRYDLFKDCPSYVHFYKSEVVKTVGTFCEYLGVGCGTPFQSGEETDYAIRSLDAGFSIARMPWIVIRHPAVNLHHPAVLPKARAYGVGRMQLLRKHQFPWWFKITNVLYPLLCLPFDCAKECMRIFRYRYTIFAGRLKGLRGSV